MKDLLQAMSAIDGQTSEISRVVKVIDEIASLTGVVDEDGNHGGEQQGATARAEKWSIRTSLSTWTMTTSRTSDPVTDLTLTRLCCKRP